MKALVVTVVLGLTAVIVACGTNPKPQDPSSTSPEYGASSGGEGSNGSSAPSGTPDPTQAPGAPQTSPAPQPLPF